MDSGGWSAHEDVIQSLTYCCGGGPLYFAGPDWDVTGDCVFRVSIFALSLWLVVWGVG